MDLTFYKMDLIKEQLRIDFYWLISDLAQKYDDIFFFPYRRFDAIKAGAKEFILRKEMIPGEAPVTIRHTAFDDMLERWRKEGEDIERIFYWYASLQGNYRRTKWSYKGPRHWRRVLYWWSNEPAYQAKFLPQDRFKAFMRLVHRDFTAPLKKYTYRCDQDDERWVEDASYRSEWDNWLWDHAFKESYVAPTTAFWEEGENVLLRRFWKKHRAFLTAEEQDLLFEEMKHRFEISHLGKDMKWDTLAPFEQAMDFDTIPDFDTYKRDW